MEAFFRGLRNKSADRDDDSSGGEFKVARVLTQPTKPESSSGKRATPSAELESGSKRVLKNVSSLGEIQLVDMSVVCCLIRLTMYSCRIALTIGDWKSTRSRCCVRRHRSGGKAMLCLSANRCGLCPIYQVHDQLVAVRI